MFITLATQSVNITSNKYNNYKFSKYNKWYKHQCKDFYPTFSNILSTGIYYIIISF